MAATKIVVLGWMGMQKSTLCNKLLGLSDDHPNAFQVGEGHKPVTSYTESKTANIGDNAIEIFDTPGDGETQDEEKHHREQQITALKAAEYFNAVIIVFNWDAARLAKAKDVMLQKFAQLFGRPIWENLCFVFTGISSRRGRQLALKEPDLRREFCNEAVQVMGGDDIEVPFFSVNLYSDDPDKGSDNQIDELLQWAITRPQLTMADLDCPDMLYKAVEVEEKMEQDIVTIPNDLTWEYVKSAGKVTLAALAVAGTGCLAATMVGATIGLLGGTTAVVKAGTLAGAVLTGGGIGMARGEASEGSYFLPQHEKRVRRIRNIRVTRRIPWFGPPVSTAEVLSETHEEL